MAFGAEFYRMPVSSFRRRATCSDHARLPELLQFFRRVAELRTYLVGVLAEQRRAHDVHRGVRESQWRADSLERSALGMVDRDDRTQLGEGFVLEQFLRRLKRSAVRDGNES